MDFTVKTDEGSYDLEAYARFIGNSLLVAIWGGEKPHIGAVSVAQPRPSLKDPGITSATSSVICLLGHKEDDLAKAGSEILASALNTEVVVTVGIHWDNLDGEGIKKVIRNAEVLLDVILDRISSEYS
ncbi:MAG: hypothetical protein JRJ20_03820 [Deltaproteobacteria bacterium]|nr:hypothetical protein [Deltaproteobacteria bacterium]